VERRELGRGGEELLSGDWVEKRSEGVME